MTRIRGAARPCLNRRSCSNFFVGKNHLAHARASPKTNFPAKLALTSDLTYC